MRCLLCSTHTNSIITYQSITPVVLHSISPRKSTGLAAHYQAPLALWTCRQSKAPSNHSRCSSGAFIIDFKTLLNPLSRSTRALRLLAASAVLSLPSPTLLSGSPVPTNQVKALQFFLLKGSKVKTSRCRLVLSRQYRVTSPRPLQKERDIENICPQGNDDGNVLSRKLRRQKKWFRNGFFVLVWQLRDSLIEDLYCKM